MWVISPGEVHHARREDVQGQSTRNPASERQVEENRPPETETTCRNEGAKLNMGAKGREHFKQRGMKLVSATEQSSTRIKKFTHQNGKQNKIKQTITKTPSPTYMAHYAL